MTKRDIEITTPEWREVTADFLARIDWFEKDKRVWKEFHLGKFHDNRRLVVIARNIREADDYLRSIHVHRKDALVIVGHRGIDNLRSLRADENRVVTIGHWGDGFRLEMDRSELLYLLKVRNLEVTHVQDWR